MHTLAPVLIERGTSWDPTARVTLALAVITLRVIVGVWPLLQTRQALKQTQAEIELSRAESARLTGQFSRRSTTRAR